jgi:biofilm PGA synthesis N-glycosyltransferase PgaC
MAVILLLYMISFLLIWQFVGYPLLMGIVALRTRPEFKSETSSSFVTPFVSIVVPAYNEEQMIEERIENLDALDYPKKRYEIIIVESGSTDATAQIVEEQMAIRGQDQPRLTLVREQERCGKASAINAGKVGAAGKIVLVTDANASFNSGALRYMMAHFADPKVGAVGGKYAVTNPDQGMAAEESFYWDLEYIMRQGESVLDSTCLFHGEINAWRKGLVEADIGIISEDLDMAIQIRRKGYRIVYEPRAVAYERTGTTPGEQIIRRKKVSTGTMLCMRKHLDYFMLPRDLYSAFIFPSHKGLVMFSPFMLLTVALLYLISWDLGIVAVHLASTGIVFAALFRVLMALRSRLIEGPASQQGKTGFSLVSLARMVRYVLLNEYLLLLAWKDFISGEYSVLWERAESTRSALDPVSPNVNSAHLG